MRLQFHTSVFSCRSQSKAKGHVWRQAEYLAQCRRPACPQIYVFQRYRRAVWLSSCPCQLWTARRSTFVVFSVLQASSAAVVPPPPLLEQALSGTAKLFFTSVHLISFLLSQGGAVQSSGVEIYLPLRQTGRIDMKVVCIRRFASMNLPEGL